MSDDNFPKGLTADYIGRFSERAEQHTFVSYGIMAMIFGLFGVCGYIFFQAQDIDRSKGSVQLYQEIKTAKDAQAIIIKAAEDEYNGVTEEAKAGQRTTLDVLNAIDFLGQARTKAQLLDAKVHLALETGYASEVDTAKSKEELEVVGQGIAGQLKMFEDYHQLSLERFKVGEITHTDVAQTERFVGEANQKRELNDQMAKVAPSAAQVRQTGTQIDTLSLVGTSLIRFGGVAVTLFLMAVLVPIYRYNVRMSSYYLGLADALTLCKDVAIPNFGELVALMTPTIVFDKEPKTPIEAAASLAKEAASLVKKG